MVGLVGLVLEVEAGVMWMWGVMELVAVLVLGEAGC